MSVAAALADEEFDVVEILGQKALFSNGRLPVNSIPEGCSSMTFVRAMTEITSVHWKSSWELTLVVQS